MDLIMLGTGNASVLDCYNSCFILTENNNHILVDGGGGSAIFKQLNKVGIDWKQIRNIIVTHKHLDHLMGILWIVRMYCQHINRDEHSGTLHIYSHDEVIFLIKDFIKKFLEKKDYELLNKSLFLVEVTDDENITINNNNITFFDIKSNKAKQYGFRINYEKDKILTCCGDEPFNNENKKHVKNSNWLIHEAFCLKSEEKEFKAYQKNHSTVTDACKIAEKLNIKNLVLYHTEDKNIKNRKELYLSEGEKYFTGNLYVPYDLEVISL